MKLDFTPDELTILAKALAPEVAKELKTLFKPWGQDGDVIFTPDTLSAYLHVSKDKIYNMTHLKEIPYSKVGRELRFRKKEIDSWLQENYTPALNGNGIFNRFRGGVAK